LEKIKCNIFKVNSRLLFMDNYEKKLNSFLKENDSDAELLIFNKSCHSVEEAAETAKVCTTDLIKSICMIDTNGDLIVAIVKGEDRASTGKVSKSLTIERPRIASPGEMLEKTGYPCGGTPPFGYAATFLIDPKVMEKEVVYVGGGSKYALVKITTKELKRLNNGIITRVSK
jgi:prolyl-tRNA editing enzyme YbaK/EbsC (Cys-tRNA(Pro) deacylase)